VEKSPWKSTRNKFCHIFILYTISPFLSMFHALCYRPALFLLKNGKLLKNYMIYLVSLKISSVAVYTNYRVTRLLMSGDPGRLGTLIYLVSVESSRRYNLMLLNLSSGDCPVCVLNNVNYIKILYSVNAPKVSG
jgi:hypothetical protein